MKKLFADVKKILADRVYLTVTLFVGLLCYGFEMTHFSMGIDDISMELYLDRGLLPETGRWVLFLINKIVPVSDFSPFFSEMIGFVLLYISAAIFCVLLRRILGQDMPVWISVIFTSFFISNPLISELDIYYLHNAADIGWLCVGVAVLFSYEILRDFGKDIRKNILRSVPVTLLVWAASGCYESFIFVYLVCMMLVLVLEGVSSGNAIKFSKLLFVSIYCAVICVVSFLLRSIICSVIPVVFRLNDVTSDYVGYRSAFDSVRELLLSGNYEPVKNVIRDQIVRYHLNGLVYLPITLYVATMFILFVFCIIMSIRKKSISYFLIWLALEIIPFLQSFISGYVSPYRSAQFLPVTIAFVMALCMYCCLGMKKYGRAFRAILGIASFILILNSCSRLNYNFYLDHMRYENDKSMMMEVTRDIYEAASSGYGSEVCVLFTGFHSVPLAFRDGFYISCDNPRYRLMRSIIKPLNASLWSVEGHVADGRYFYDGEMQYPLYVWGMEAFNGTNDELVRFINMHGANLSTPHDPDLINSAKVQSNDMPCWPAEGSISVMDGYILVHM